MPTATGGVIGDPEVQQLIVAAGQIRDFLDEILITKPILAGLDNQLNENINSAWEELCPSMADEIINQRFAIVNSYGLQAVGLTGAQLSAKLNALRFALGHKNIRQALKLAKMLLGSLAAILKLKDWAEGIKEFLELIESLLPYNRG